MARTFGDFMLEEVVYPAAAAAVIVGVLVAAKETIKWVSTPSDDEYFAKYVGLLNGKLQVIADSNDSKLNKVIRASGAVMSLQVSFAMEYRGRDLDNLRERYNVYAHARREQLGLV